MCVYECAFFYVQPSVDFSLNPTPDILCSRAETKNQTTGLPWQNECATRHERGNVCVGEDIYSYLKKYAQVSVILCLTCSRDGSDIYPHVIYLPVSAVKVTCEAGVGGSLRKSKGLGKQWQICWVCLKKCLSAFARRGVSASRESYYGPWATWFITEAQKAWPSTSVSENRALSGNILLRTWEKHPLQGCLCNIMCFF